MKAVIGLLLMLAGVALGLYIGIFVEHINIEVFKDGMKIFGTMVGWGISFAMLVFGFIIFIDYLRELIRQWRKR